jgi:hypothetical protein
LIGFEAEHTMSTSPSKSPKTVAVAALLACIAGSGAIAESMPDSENGRYALSPVTDGVIRLDTRTGTVSTCTNSGPGWACYAVPDERAALDAEIGRLQADNEKLKAEIAAREPAVGGKTDEALPKSDSLKQAEPKAAESKAAEPKAADSERKIEIPLPSDQDMDRVMSFLERAWRRDGQPDAEGCLRQDLRMVVPANASNL